MADTEPGPSTDRERAPLLGDPEAGAANQNTPSFTDRVNAVAQEPFTPLTKILLIIALVLLLASSVFIGLFAGAQHKLALERDRNPGTTISRVLTTTEYQTLPRTETRILTETERTTTTKTQVGSTTRVGTVTATTILTTTTKVTKTAKPVPIPEPTGGPDKNVCFEPHCVVLAGAILSSLDTTQDPCENFYEYVNNGWLKAHPLPADKSSYGNFEALAQQNKQVIQQILESSDESESNLARDSDDKEILQKLRDMYSSCLNEAQLDEIGSSPLTHFIQTIRKLFREEDTDISATEGKKSKGLTAALAFIHSRGISSLFSLDIEGDVGVDPNHMVLWFSQPDFGLPSKEYFEEKSIRKLYQTVVERFLTILDDGDDEEDEIQVDNAKQTSFSIKEKTQRMWPPWPWPPWDGDDDGGGGDGDDKPPKHRDIHKLAEKVVDFERKMAKASLDLDILFQDPLATYNPVRPSALFDALPQIDFPTYFSTFTPRRFPNRVIMTYPAYAKSLASILSETSNEVVESYLVVRAALALSPYLGMNTDAWQAQRTLLEALTGIKKGAVGDRGEYCVGKVEETLGFAAGRYFVNQTFGGESKQKGTKIITNIVKTFKASLSHIDWMDKQSAQAAAEKADAIRVKVGYPLSPNTESSRSIARYYSSVKVDKTNFFNNMLNAQMSEILKRWLKLEQSRDPESWEMWPSMVNAYFNPPANEIVFPAGILQPPFFSQEWPGYLSYGAFGQVASHELTHAFDSAGRLYNQKGKLEEWWTNSTSEGFKVKQDCIVKQFSAYTIDDGKGGKIHVNGNLTSGENIGDTGLIQAFRAWKAQFDDSSRGGGEYLLPGLEYTREQLFFIAFGRIWARAMKTAAAVQRIRTDPHSPSRYRVDGTVSNIPEFAEAFKCPKGARLNPPREKQCIFWG
ncbi:zincin [Macrolepiota fuliginosa MF-IS2]|uniref:Zincin n=1 Tax=Macrolepiota fuliginosa MF-IS2 TaxID=1400762 RepID=A0A9P6C5T7_9AGAR|nr:zincin [Macrolepiota fuliginosa MF-IS2]